MRLRLWATTLLIALVISACGEAASDTTEATGESSTSTTAVDPSTTTTSSTTSSSTTTVVLAGVDCPAGQPVADATVSGVENWVRLRGAPSLDSEELGQVDVGTVLGTYPATLSYDGTRYWWVMVELPNSDRCAHVAAEFLANGGGRLDLQIPGVTFRTPRTGTWTFSERTTPRDPVEGFLDGAFYTSYSAFVFDGNLIEQKLAEQLQQFEEFAYDYPENWYSEVVVPGADRAVRVIATVSESGDILADRLLIEVGTYTIDASTSIYIEDLDKAPTEELEDFLVSFQIDPDTFVDRMSAP